MSWPPTDASGYLQAALADEIYIGTVDGRTKCGEMKESPCADP